MLLIVGVQQVDYERLQYAHSELLAEASRASEAADSLKGRCVAAAWLVRGWCCMGGAAWVVLRGWWCMGGAA